jgi:negative regulator of sigma E activity
VSKNSAKIIKIIINYRNTSISFPSLLSSKFGTLSKWYSAETVGSDKPIRKKNERKKRKNV